MKANFIQNTIAQLPPQVKVFLKRALLFFIAWKLLYHLILFPLHIPDKQLTDITAETTSFLYRNLINSNTSITLKDQFKDGVLSTIVYLDDKPTLGIADGCNGLELYILYMGFILCFPTNVKRQTIYIIIGVVSIFILNGFRCLGLTWVFTNHYSYFGIAHHYIFKIIIYAFIFYLWTLYAKKLKHVS